MSFEDIKEHLLKQDGRHKSNREIPVGNGEIKTAPSYDVEVAFGSSSKDSTAEDWKKQIIKQGDRNAPNNRQEIESKGVNEKITTNLFQKNINEDELPNFEDEGM